MKPTAPHAHNSSTANLSQSTPDASTVRQGRKRRESATPPCEKPNRLFAGKAGKNGRPRSRDGTRRSATTAPPLA